MLIQLIVLFVALNSVALQTTPCKFRPTKHGSVCVCTSKYCDYLVNPKPTGNNVIAVTSTKAGLRFATSYGSFNSYEKTMIRDYRTYKTAENYPNKTLDNIEHLISKYGMDIYLHLANEASTGKLVRSSNAVKQPIRLTVDRKCCHQKIVGFGGAFTGAVSYLLQNMDSKLQDQLYKSYFHEAGIGFNLLRMSIGGSDFDLEPWAYNELPINDAWLSNFTKLDQRDLNKVQQIKRLRIVSEINELKIMGTAWGPPKWMKTNNDWSGFGFLKKQYYRTWANYHLRFIELMANESLPIWAITTGNEPLNGVIGWFLIKFISLGWTPEQQAIWLSEHLGPTIKKSKHKNVLIFGNDDQRYTFPAWFDTMKSVRNDSLDYLDGLAVHWYFDGVFPPELIDVAHHKMPEKLILNTEASVGVQKWQKNGPVLGSWERGELYIKSLLQDFQHSFNGWIDWNILLNEIGGPNYVNNHVDAPIIVNTTTYQEFYKQPLFYAMGHFSKFVPPNSVRISTMSSNFAVDVVGFQRPDGSIAVVAFNSEDVPLDISLEDSQQGTFNINIPARSINTFIYT